MNGFPIPHLPCLAFLAVVTTAGCGAEGPYSGSLYPVRGRVLLSDGTPLQGGSIQFIPKVGGLPASGTIDDEGGFTLKSHKGREEGAAPGEYKVRIDPGAEYLTRKRKGGSAKPPFSAKYRDYDGETGLTATIEARTMELEPFRLDAK